MGSQRGTRCLPCSYVSYKEFSYLFRKTLGPDYVNEIFVKRGQASIERGLLLFETARTGRSRSTPLLRGFLIKKTEGGPRTTRDARHRRSYGRRIQTPNVFRSRPSVKFRRAYDRTSSFADPTTDDWRTHGEVSKGFVPDFPFLLCGKWSLGSFYVLTKPSKFDLFWV